MCVFVSVALSYSRGLSLPAAGAVVKFLLSFILLLPHADQQQFVGVNTHTHAEISQEKESTKFKITTEKEKVRVWVCLCVSVYVCNFVSECCVCVSDCLYVCVWLFVCVITLVFLGRLLYNFIRSYFNPRLFTHHFSQILLVVATLPSTPIFTLAPPRSLLPPSLPLSLSLFPSLSFSYYIDCWL